MALLVEDAGQFDAQTKKDQGAAHMEHKMENKLQHLGKTLQASEMRKMQGANPHQVDMVVEQTKGNTKVTTEVTLNHHDTKQVVKGMRNNTSPKGLHSKTAQEKDHFVNRQNRQDGWKDDAKSAMDEYNAMPSDEKY